jgi:SAM-dependent methyltransferase
MRYPQDKEGLTERILETLKEAGKDVDHLTTADLIALDEIHIRGRAATRELAQTAAFPAGGRILDIGSGIGGPARTLASEFGLAVTGIEISDECCKATRALNERTGLSESITIVHGDAVNMPFEDGIFDGVVMLHSGMNIANKRRLLAEIRRVLRDDGTVALYEVLAGPVGNPHFPVIWADNCNGNHLLHPDQMREMIVESGFEVRTWSDVTREARDWYGALIAKFDGGFRPAVSMEAVVGPDFIERGRNVSRNLQEHRIEVVQAVLEAKA